MKTPRPSNQYFQAGMDSGGDCIATHQLLSGSGVVAGVFMRLLAPFSCGLLEHDQERGGSVPSPIPRRAPTRGGDSLSIRCSGRASPQLVSGAKLLEDPVSRPLTRPSGQSPCTARPNAGGGGVSRDKNGAAVKRRREGKGALAVVGCKRCLTRWWFEGIKP